MFQPRERLGDMHGIRGVAFEVRDQSFSGTSPSRSGAGENSRGSQRTARIRRDIGVLHRALETGERVGRTSRQDECKRQLTQHPWRIGFQLERFVESRDRRAESAVGGQRGCQPANVTAERGSRRSAAAITSTASTNARA
jgi:hypothetical protein